MEKISNGVLAPIGFYGNGIEANVKKSGLDLGLIYSKSKCNIAGVFTKNLVKAAPVLHCIDKIKKNKLANAIVINSGNANACTGLRGELDVKLMSDTVANSLSVEDDAVYVCSTGVIGVTLPITNIVSGIKSVFKRCDNTEIAADNIARSIMTTDLEKKEIAYKVDVNGECFKIGGIAKGSGMIHPNMGTMLSFITTDVKISNSLLDKCLKEVVNKTYNMISVDGDTSTNDTCLVLANGESGISIIENTKEYELFKESMYQVNEYLAKAIVADGEGATRVFEVNVSNALTQQDADSIAKSVITSNLVKTAIFGSDANFGRILCAMGYSNGYFTQDKSSLYISANDKKILLFNEGKSLTFNEELAKEILENKYIYIDIMLSDGMYNATAWGCDLSYEYVKINGEYRS